jgi:glycosyltransferase involved in cell wall biosynthesis
MYSVVIPTHNRPDLVARAIRSVLAQTVLPAKIIVIDDASQPALKLPDDLRNDRILVIRHELSVGGAAARNAGLREAPTSIVAFLDDDDEWLPRKMEIQLGWLQKNPEAALVTCGHLRCEAGRQYHEVFTERMVDQYREYDNFFGSFSYLVVRRTVGILLDGSLPALQDWDFALRVTRGNTFGVIEEALVKYHAHDLPRITNKPGNHLRALRHCYLKHRFHFSDDARRWVLARVIFERARHMSSPGRRFGRVMLAIRLSAGCHVPLMMKTRTIGRRVASLGFSPRAIIAIRSTLIAAGQGIRHPLRSLRPSSIAA